MRYKIYICEATTLSHTGHSRTWRGEGDKGPGDKTDEYENDQGRDDNIPLTRSTGFMGQSSFRILLPGVLNYATKSICPIL